MPLPAPDDWVCGRCKVGRGEEPGLHPLFGLTAVGEGKGYWGQCHPCGEGTGFEAGPETSNPYNGDILMARLTEEQFATHLLEHRLTQNGKGKSLTAMMSFSPQKVWYEVRQYPGILNRVDTLGEAIDIYNKMP